jgi:hypothetical protein
VKIVKSFEDPEFLALSYNWLSEDELSKEHFYWGLGEDGEVYLKCTRHQPISWYKLNKAGSFQDCISLKLMKRIVKEFGHLVIFT